MEPDPRTTVPRGTVTFVFTDVEGSTRLLQRVGAAYASILETQRLLVRSAFEDHAGHLVDTAGDGFFFVFERAQDALRATVAAQRALAVHPWPDDAVVRVRMGLHTGEPVVSGTGYVGLDVHRAARIAAAAHGGQIVMSAITRQLVASDLPDGVALTDLGRHGLKDFPEPESLYQVDATGLDTTFPRLRTLGRSDAGHLPTRPLRLIGRTDELSSITALLVDDDVRLLTLTGAGGTGKTSLAIEAAAACMSHFRDGVAYVPLAPIDDAALVFAVVAQSLAVRPAAEQSVFDAVVEHLRDRRMLLLLDNFEHVVSVADRVATLAASCPGITLLVTSRFALRLTIEREFAVAPLYTPDAAATGSIAALRAYPAVELFTQRASALKPGLQFDDDSALAVAEICRRLDGLPLAIELAAARIKLFSPRALLARLDRRLDLLGGGARDLPDRHQTLRQAIGWSYDLLEPGEQAVFRRLAVFVGGCTLEAAETVCAAAGVTDLSTLDAVSALVDKSLLRQEPTEDGEPRFGMLETVREFALEQLAANGEDTATRAEHADFAIALAESQEPLLTGEGQPEALRILSREHDNVRSAFDWTVRTGETTRALRLGAAMCRFWIIRGFHSEGRARLGAALRLPASDADTSLRARVLSGGAILTFEQAELEEATGYLDEALATYRGLGDERHIAETLNHLGWIAFVAGDGERASELSTEAMLLHEKRGDDRGRALSLTNLGAVALHSASIVQALDLYERALELRRRQRDPRSIAYGEVNVSWALIRLGRLEQAVALATDACDILRSIGDRQILSFASYMLGEAALERGEFAEAVRYTEDAVSLARHIMQGASLGMALSAYAETLARSGQGRRGLPYAEEAVELHTKGRSHAFWREASLCALGDVHRFAGQEDEAWSSFLQVLAYAAARRLPFYGAESLACLAALASHRDDHALACRLAGASEMQRALAEAGTSRRARELDGVRTRAADALGDDATAALWSEGAASDLEDLTRTLSR